MLRHYIQLVRPLNCIMAVTGSIVGSIVAVGGAGFLAFWIKAALAGATAFIFTAAGNSLNDYHDREIDKVNHPLRPIPSGKIQPSSAYALSIGLFTATVPLSLLISLECLGIVAVNLIIMIFYEKSLKKRGLKGNLLISWLVASLFLFGGLAVYGQRSEAIERLSILSLLAFLSTLGREVVKDIEDMRGDFDRITLPKTLGIQRAGYVASGAFLLGVAMSFLPLFLNIFKIQYLIIVAVADAIFIYCSLHSFGKPHEIAKVSKYAMIVALMAFLVGGL